MNEESPAHEWRRSGGGGAKTWILAAGPRQGEEETFKKLPFILLLC